MAHGFRVHLPARRCAVLDWAVLPRTASRRTGSSQQPSWPATGWTSLGPPSKGFSGRCSGPRPALWDFQERASPDACGGACGPKCPAPRRCAVSPIPRRPLVLQGILRRLGAPLVSSLEFESTARPGSELAPPFPSAPSALLPPTLRGDVRSERRRAERAN